MYFSMTFGDKNTWDDWMLVPTTLPVIAPPKRNTQFITLPSSNSIIDLSDSLTGYTTYGRRTGTIEYVALGVEARVYTWEELKSDLVNSLYGQKMQVRYEEEPGWYYEGYVRVSNFVNDKISPKVTIEYDLDPYKWSETEDVSSFTLTDPSVTVNKTYSSYHFGEAPVVPTIVVTNSGGSEPETTEKSITYSEQFGGGAYLRIKIDETIDVNTGISTLAWSAWVDGSGYEFHLNNNFTLTIGGNSAYSGNPGDVIDGIVFASGTVTIQHSQAESVAVVAEYVQPYGTYGYYDVTITETYDLIDNSGSGSSGVVVSIRNIDSPAIFKYPNAQFAAIFYDGVTVYENAVIWGSTSEIAMRGTGTVDLITRRGKL